MAEEKTSLELCRSALLRMIRTADASEKMYREKLLRKGFLPEDIEESLSECRQAGLVSDEKLLIRHARFLAEKKYYGAVRAKLELIRLFGKEAVDLYFEEAQEEIDYRECALRFALKNASYDREKLIRRMRTNGYSVSEIKYALTRRASQD